MGQIINVASRAFSQMLLILFKPFSLKKWLCLVLIIWLAGAMGGGGGGSFNTGGGFSNSDPSSQKTSASLTGRQSPHSQNQQDAKIAKMQKAVASPLMAEKQSWIDNKVLVIGGFATLFGITTCALLAWLNGRFRFIFYDAVMHNQSLIKKPWKKYQALGNSYFRFNLAVVVGLVGSVLLIIALTLGLLYLEGTFTSGFSLAAGLTIAVALIVLTFVMIATITITHYIEQFVVPIMAIKNQRFLPSLREFTSLVKAKPKAFLVYFLSAIVLGLAGAVVTGLLSLVVMLLYVIFAAIIIGGPYFILGWTNAYIGYLVLTGSITLILLVLSVAFCSLPVATFFRAFSLYYLAEIDPQYDGFKNMAKEKGSEVEGEYMREPQPPALPA